MTITTARKIATATATGFHGHKDEAIREAFATLAASAKRGNASDDIAATALEQWAADRGIEM